MRSNIPLPTIESGMKVPPLNKPRGKHVRGPSERAALLRKIEHGNSIVIPWYQKPSWQQHAHAAGFTTRHEDVGWRKLFDPARTRFPDLDDGKYRCLRLFFLDPDLPVPEPKPDTDHAIRNSTRDTQAETLHQPHDRWAASGF